MGQSLRRGTKQALCGVLNSLSNVIAQAVKNTTEGLFGASHKALTNGLSQAGGVTVATPAPITYATVS